MASQPVLWVPHWACDYYCLETRSTFKVARLNFSARTSPFWNLFADSTLKLGFFDKENDWPEMLAPFANREIDLQVGARTELFNFSAGIPVLASALCKRVWNSVENGASISDENIARIAEGFGDDVKPILDDLWEV